MSADNRYFADNPYLSRVYNLSKKVSEWRQIAMYQIVVIFVLIGFLIYQSNSVPVRLIPQSNPEKEYLTKQNSQDTEYKRLISESDVMNYTSWTPRTVKKQFAKLVPRVAPAAYGKIRLELNKDQKRISREEISQTFNISSTQTFYDNVLFSGQLRRWMGSDIVFNDEVHYVFRYQTLNGVPYLLQKEKFNNYKEAAAFAKKGGK